jgi:DNA-binding GntR family transcriptional regulator
MRRKDEKEHARRRRARTQSSSSSAIAARFEPAPPRSAPAQWNTGRPKGTGTQRVYAQVREDIISLRLPPGADLDEASLEQRFGVSRTPVREALIRLASEGLIVLLPNRGARISHIDVADVPQLFEALELSQRATMRWAAIRRKPADIGELRKMNHKFLAAAQSGNSEEMGELNKQFHLIVGRSCGNKYLESLYVSLLSVSLRLARTAFAYAPMSGDAHQEYYMEVVRQHEAMIAAIERKDPEEADVLARLHTDLFRERIKTYLQQNLARGMALGSRA